MAAEGGKFTREDSHPMLRLLAGVGFVAVVIWAMIAIWQNSAPDPLGRGRYKVAQRIEDPGCSADHVGCRVKVVLLHDDHRLYASAVDYRVDIGGNIRFCNLHVGETVKCKFFADRNTEDAGGYDLICGDQLWNGQLATTGGNELLTIYRDELR
jgi:hypothetical protein